MTRSRPPGDRQSASRLSVQSETHLLRKDIGGSSVTGPYAARGEFTCSAYKVFGGIPIARREHDNWYDPDVTDFQIVDKFDPKLFTQP